MPDRIDLANKAEVDALRLELRNALNGFSVLPYRVSDGPPTDAPEDGHLPTIDTTNSRLYIRANGAWRYTELGDADLGLTAEQLATLASVASKADQNAVDEALALKADQDDVATALATKVNSSSYTAGLALKADQTALDAEAQARQTGDADALAAVSDEAAARVAADALKADQAAVDAAIAAVALTQEQLDRIAEVSEKVNKSELAELIYMVDADRTGVEDATAEIQGKVDTVRDAVRDAGMGVNNVVAIPAGKYRISSRLIIPPYVKLEPYGNVIFEWWGTNDSCLHITPLADDPAPLYARLEKQQWQNSDIIAGHHGGLIILNRNAIVPGTSSNKGLELGSRTDLGGSRPLSRYANTNVAIQGFDAAMRFNAYNHYLGSFSNFHVERNTVLVEVGTGGASVNSGENFAFYHSIFAATETAFNINAPAFDFNFISCSFDYIYKQVFKIAYGYGRCHLVSGHIEQVNETLHADGGIVVSTASSPPSVQMDGTVILCKSQTLFKGAVNLAGTAQIRAFDGNANTTYPNAITCEDTVQSHNFRNVGRINRRIISRNDNLIQDPFWKKEAVGAGKSSLLDWNISKASGAVTVAVVASSPEAGGQSLEVVLPENSYITLTYAWLISTIDRDNASFMAAFKTDLAGLRLENSVTLYDAAGSRLAETASIQVAGTTALQAGIWHLPNYLNNIASVNMQAYYRATSVKPRFTFVNPSGSGAPMTIQIPFLYFGR